MENPTTEYVQDAVVVVNKDKIIEYLNPAYEELTGIKISQIIGSDISRLEKFGYISKSLSLYILERKEPATLLQKIYTGKQVFFQGIPVFDSSGNIVKVISTGWSPAKRAALMSHAEQENNGEMFVTKSQAMGKIINRAKRIAATDCSVLIRGETGVGKEVMAQFIHQNSRRRGSFVAINCAAIPDTLFESELFGYRKGAFTGSHSTGKRGLVEVAAGGTLFLDEIGDLSLSSQVKLLRFLDTGSYIPLGDDQPRVADVRVISATNQDLEKAIREGRFREDLYYRLATVTLELPPLRKRKEDIPYLVNYFLTGYNLKYGLHRGISQEVLEKLVSYPWPGNIRELKHTIEHAVIVAESDMVSFSDLPVQISDYESKNEDESLSISINRTVSLAEAKRQLEQLLIQEAIRETKSLQEAARILDIDPSTLYRRLKFLNIDISNIGPRTWRHRRDSTIAPTNPRPAQHQ